MCGLLSGRRLCAVAVVTAGLILSTGPAAAQNLITNGSFDSNIEGWSAERIEVTLFFRSDTGNTLPGGSGPGSLEVQYADWIAGNYGAEQLVQQIEEGVTYTFSGTTFVPGDEDNLAQAIWFKVTWKTESGAAITVDNFRVGGNPLEKDAWLSGSEDLVAPAGTSMAEIAVQVYTPPLEDETRPGVAYFDDISFAEKGATTARQVLFVPASASVNGSNGTFWTTTGWFANKVGFPVELKAAFLRQGQDNTATLDSLTSIGTVPGGGYLEIEDIAALAGGAGLAGGLYIEATAQAGGLPATLVEATTYTFTPNPEAGGGYGQGLPAVTAGTSSTVTIPGIYQNSAHRTNIGVLNTSGASAEIEVRIFGADGGALALENWTLRPYEHKQVSVNSLGVTDAFGGYVTFTRVSAGGSFRAYASVVDQRTGDAVYTAGR